MTDVPAAGRRGPGGPVAAAGVLAAVLAGAYLLRQPPVPDLSAQDARAYAGTGVWWDGWYGGVHTPAYSVLGPPVTGLLGPPLAGALAAVVAAVLAAVLLRPTRRPLGGALLVAVLLVADVVTGRTVFALGLVPALGALVVLQGRRRTVAAAVLAVLSALFSPVSALLLGVAAAAVFLTDPPRRRAAVAVAAAVAVPVVALAVLFPEPGRMPYTWDALKPALFASIGLVPALWDRRARVVQVGAALSVVLVLGAYLVPSPIGSNAERLALLFAAPVALACSPLPRPLVALLLVPLLWFPERNLRQEVVRSHDASAHASYDAPLVAELTRRFDGVHRVEVVDPRTHRPSADLVRRVPLARGWERQVDDALNPIFYGRARLDAASYRTFLDDYAVRWVALPDAPLDFAAAAEGRLVRRGLPYLTPVWRDAHWVLYEVRAPAPLATGAVRAVGVGQREVRLDAVRAGTGEVRVRWSRWLRVTGGCVAKAPGGWTTVRIDRAGPATLRAGLGLGDGC